MGTLRDLERYTFDKHPDLQARFEARKPRMKVVDALLSMRRARAMSQRNLAEKAGVSQPTIARLESADDDRLQTTEKLVEYARGLGVHVGLVFVAKDGDNCAVLETASLSEDSAVSGFLDRLRALSEECPPAPNHDNEGEVAAR